MGCLLPLAPTAEHLGRQGRQQGRQDGSSGQGGQADRCYLPAFRCWVLRVCGLSCKCLVLPALREVGRSGCKSVRPLLPGPVTLRDHHLRKEMVTIIHVRIACLHAEPWPLASACSHSISCDHMWGAVLPFCRCVHATPASTAGQQALPLCLLPENSTWVALRGWAGLPPSIQRSCACGMLDTCATSYVHRCYCKHLCCCEVTDSC